MRRSGLLNDTSFHAWLEANEPTQPVSALLTRGLGRVPMQWNSQRTERLSCGNAGPTAPIRKKASEIRKPFLFVFAFLFSQLCIRCDAKQQRRALTLAELRSTPSTV